MSDFIAQALALKAISSGGSGDAYTKAETDALLGGKADLVDGKVPASELPSYVDDTVEGYYYNGAFYEDSSHTTAITGETGKIYVDLTANKSYRWTGSVYTRIDECPSFGETAGTIYEGNKGKANADAITAIKDGITLDSFADVESALAGKANTSSLATVATSGSYNDLSGKPTLGTAAALNVASSGNASTSEVVKGNDTRLTDSRTPTAHTHTKSEITDFPTLATVATSGSYSDLSNKPTLGAAASRGVDTTPTSGSTNLITSGGVYTIVGNINTVLESVL